MTNQRTPYFRHLAVVLAALMLIPAITRSQTTSAGTLPVREAYDAHNKAAMSARSAGDWAAVRRHAAAVDTLFNGNPSSLLAIARAHARLGETTEALDLVRTVVAMGVSRNLAGDQDLASLHSLPEWSELVAKNESNARVIGEPRVVFALPTLDLIAEDIVWDGGRDRYLVSSVRKGTITAVSRDGRSREFAARKSLESWGLFALALDSIRSRLWATTVAMPHVEGLSAADSGKSAILRLDAATGAVQKRYELGPHARGNSPGDVTLAPNGDLFVSDSRTGILYVVRARADSLEVLVPEGMFMSPQSPAFSRDGRSLVVADYIRGLAAVDVQTGTVRWLKHDRDVALNGIDGLVRSGPTTFIAIQNGVMPNRVMQLTIDDAATAVTGARVIAQNTASIHEPTHGVVLNGEFHFIANSGWDAFDDSGVMSKDAKLSPPVVLAIPIDRR